VLEARSGRDLRVAPNRSREACADIAAADLSFECGATPHVSGNRSAFARLDAQAITTVDVPDRGQARETNHRSRNARTSACCGREGTSDRLEDTTTF